MTTKTSNTPLAGLVATFCQDGNTMGTTCAYEAIEVRLEYQLPGEEPFIVIKTEGWSADSIGEIELLLRNVVDAAKDIQHDRE